MKKTLFIIIIAVAAISIILGTKAPSFERVKNSIESVEASSYDLTADIATITIASFAISDFASHADKIELEFYMGKDHAGFATGESGWIYRSWEETENDPTGTHTRYLREEKIVVTPEGWSSEGAVGASYADYYFMCTKAAAPIADLVNFDRSEEEEWGFFERVFNTIRLGVLTIQTVLYAIVVAAVDTIGLVWNLVFAFFHLVGLTS